MTYPGGKNASYRQLINQIPPHRHTVELFAGSAALLRNMAPAPAAIAIDADPKATYTLRASRRHLPPETAIVDGDALEWLDIHGQFLDEQTFIYADPPYLMDTRSSHRQIYRCEFHTAEEHYNLLQHLQRLNCLVMVSGYQSALYDMQIGDWRQTTYTAQTHGGPRTETLWMNYPEPTQLHDCSYLGDNYRERERIKRKIQRWKKRLRQMDNLERQALLEAIEQATW